METDTIVDARNRKYRKCERTRQSLGQQEEVCRQLKRNQKGAGSKSLLVECPECGHVFFRKKKKFVDGPALQMGRATKTVCLDTAIIRCQPAQEDEVRAELKKTREAHSGLSNRRWKKVIDC